MTDCAVCPQYSYVCEGTIDDSWWTRSAALGLAGICNLQMEIEDKILLEDVLKMRLSEKAAEDMKLNTTFQKPEAANKGLSVSVPNNVNLPRNFEQRVHSAILRMTNAQGTAISMKVSELGGKISPLVNRTLQSFDSRREYHKKYKKQHKVKKRRNERFGNLRFEHREYMKKKERRDVDIYQKGKLDHAYASQ